ncbi:MAG: site-specific integrase [Prevotella sp.]|nr:site-specific integrase [Prevotella sp.]
MERKEDRTTKGISVKLCFRPSSVSKKNGRLYYQIIIRRSSFQYNSQYQIHETEWDKHTRLVIKDCSSSRGKELQAIRKHAEWDMSKLHEIILRLIDEFEVADHNLVIQEFEIQKSQQSFRNLVKKLVARLEQRGKTRTAETYLSTYRSFMRFLDKNDILLYEMDANMIEDYELWLQNDGLIPNSTSFYMRILHTILNKAVKLSLLPSCDFFQNVYTGIAPTAKRTIRIEDLKRIKALNLRTRPNLDFARDMFLLSLYFRGMSFIDMANIQHKNLQNGHLVYYRQKTGQRLDIKWEKQMSDILDKYPMDAKYLLPILRTPDKENRKYYKNASKQINRWLKKVGTMANIHIPLTMYVARHTWASLAKQKNIPIGVISDGLGHDSEKTTLIYLSTLDTSAVDDANSKILADLL